MAAETTAFGPTKTWSPMRRGMKEKTLTGGRAIVSGDASSWERAGYGRTPYISSPAAVDSIPG